LKNLFLTQGFSHLAVIQKSDLCLSRITKNRFQNDCYCNAPTENYINISKIQPTITEFKTNATTTEQVKPLQNTKN